MSDNQSILSRWADRAFKAEQECDHLRALNVDLRDALAAMLDIYDHPYLIGQEQRVASCRVTLIGREIEFKDKEAFWQEVRAILAKAEATE